LYRELHYKRRKLHCVNAGISVEAAEAEDADKKPKKVVYGNKKTQKKKEEPSKVHTRVCVCAFMYCRYHEYAYVNHRVCVSPPIYHSIAYHIITKYVYHRVCVIA